MLLMVHGVLCASAVRGKVKLVPLSRKSCGILKYKFSINFSSSNWNHNFQPRTTAFVVGGIGAANQERGPNILGTTQKENKTLCSPRYSLF